MPIIREIKSNSSLNESIQHLSEMAQGAFKKLSDCLNGEPGHENFQKYVGQIRHNVVFHYDKKSKLVADALADRDSRPEARISKVTWGDISCSRFELADDIVDSIVCRGIWKIPRADDLRSEADRIADFGSDLCRSFLDFSGEFVYRYLEDNSCFS